MRHLLSFGLIALVGLANAQSGKPWIPPKTTIPPEYVDAVKRLLGKGIGDPRSGTFSRVTIRVGDAAWTGPTDFEALGWVLPDKKRIVAVDGLTYAIVKDHGSVPFTTLFKKKEESSFRSARTITVNVPTPVLAGLLLVRGETSNGLPSRRFERNSGFNTTPNTTRESSTERCRKSLLPT